LKEEEIRREKLRELWKKYGAKIFKEKLRNPKIRTL